MAHTGTKPVLPATVREALEGFDAHVTAEVVAKVAVMLNDLNEDSGMGRMPHNYTGCSMGCFSCIRDWLLGKQDH